MTGYLLWKWLQVIDIEPHGWRVNIASDNGVVATGNKPLTEPTLVHFYIATLHQWSIMSCHHTEIGFQLFANRQRCLQMWLSYDTCLCSCTIVSTTQCLARLYGMKNVENNDFKKCDYFSIVFLYFRFEINTFQKVLCVAIIGHLSIVILLKRDDNCIMISMEQSRIKAILISVSIYYQRSLHMKQG